MLLVHGQQRSTSGWSQQRPARRFLSTTTATTFGLVGSLNKIPLAVIGLVAFNAPWSNQNVASIGVGLIAGIVFVRAKQQR